LRNSQVKQAAGGRRPIPASPTGTWEMAARIHGNMIPAGDGGAIKTATKCLTIRVCHMDTGLTGEGETMSQEGTAIE
jgi:hypothetical protein